MKFRCDQRKIRREKRERRYQDWHPWFAWYPVKIRFNDCRWLEKVERRFLKYYRDTSIRWAVEYRSLTNVASV